MKIEFYIGPPDGALTLDLVLVDNEGGIVHTRQVATGFQTPGDAMDALLEAITYMAPPPPDLSGLEIAAEKVTELATGAEEVADAIRILGERLNTVEDRLDAQGSVQPHPGKRSLLPGRDSAAQHHQQQVAQPPAPARPSIRRTNQLPEPDQNLGGRVHGSMFGGPSRRGRGPATEE